jgi:hypothetical protein
MNGLIACGATTSPASGATLAPASPLDDADLLLPEMCAVLVPPLLAEEIARPEDDPNPSAPGEVTLSPL